VSVKKLLPYHCICPLICLSRHEQSVKRWSRAVWVGSEVNMPWLSWRFRFPFDFWITSDCQLILCSQLYQGWNHSCQLYQAALNVNKRRVRVTNKSCPSRCICTHFEFCCREWFMNVQTLIHWCDLRVPFISYKNTSSFKYFTFQYTVMLLCVLVLVWLID
jgi:hypothetical protein